MNNNLIKVILPLSILVAEWRCVYSIYGLLCVFFGQQRIALIKHVSGTWAPVCILS